MSHMIHACLTRPCVVNLEAAAADSLRLCPSMFHGQFQYSVSDGGVTSCGGTGSDMSTCSSQYTLEFDYSLCSKIMAYSGSGLVKCVYELEVGAYTVTMVMNQDPALTTDTERFTCLVSQSAGNGTVFVSLSPGSCMRIQTPFETPVLPTEPNTTTTTTSSTTTTTSTTTSLPLTTNMATPAAATSESEDQTLVYVLIAVGCLTGGLVTALATIVVCRYCKRTQKPPCQTPDIIIETLPHKTAGYSMMPFSSMQAPRQDTILGDHISEKDVTVFPQTQSIDLTQNISKNMTSTSLVSQSGHTSNNVLSTVPESAQMVTRQFSAGHLKSRVNVPSWRLVSDSSATLQPVIPPDNRGSPDSDQDYVFASTPKAQAHVVRQNSYSGETTRQFTNKVNPNRESVSRDHSLKREKTTTITVPTLDGIIMDDTVNFALRYSSRMMTCKREFEEGKFKSNRSNLSERVVQIATTDPPSRQNSMLGRRCSEPAILARADSFYGTQMAPIQSTASNDHKTARRALTAKTGRSATFFIGASKPQPTLINSFEQADVFHPETSSVRVSPVSEASLPVSPEARNTPQITHQQTDHLL
ncbi:hypothetical protein MAR_024063 [Mya arenaria]|uniref:DUF7042 domain-containing protein n=1 Tax=Mya arenaria TaxID=6604 RepID=A0ABY7DSN1_MYAAR|nr:hypothetical protein MAR_024063 [Mya arenaria]